MKNIDIQTQIDGLIHLVSAKRSEVGMTQKDLADKLSVSRATVAQIERCALVPSLTLLIKILDVLGYELTLKEKEKEI